MSHLKVIICLVMVILLVVLSVVPAMANSIRGNLTISDGTVKGTYFATVDAGCTSTTTVTVQKKVDGVWTTAAYSSGSKKATASGSADGGTEFRATAVLTVYKDGKQVDRLTVSSYK